MTSLLDKTLSSLQSKVAKYSRSEPVMSRNDTVLPPPSVHVTV